MTIDARERRAPEHDEAALAVGRGVVRLRSFTRRLDPPRALLGDAMGHVQELARDPARVERDAARRPRRHRDHRQYDQQLAKPWRRRLPRRHRASVMLQRAPALQIDVSD
jgi:hypothetical protein